jgi:hypothetical protein
VEASPSGAREPGVKRLADAVRAAGGDIRAFKAPKAGELAGWIEAEARERGLKLGPGAARMLASRVGGFVTDNDADRRNQTMIVDRELDKLALYRPDGTVSTEDVEALVAEAVPGSVWAFTDAVGRRDVGRSVELLGRLVETTPEPVLLAVLHRHGGMPVMDQDVFVNLVGGLRLSETAGDLPVLMAIASSHRDRPVPREWVVFGEVGLNGEVRPVANGEERLREAVKQGFRHALVPALNAPRTVPDGMEVTAVRTLREALAIL